ncbi:MAG: efflux RND transporter periplasmic adaptor subunit [Kiritimatiellae bacterium]|nr:efflux RND transporter periplasmic adaptor subunit [Kiritimatiellia bacterium]MDD5523174.1 efflux RND transporter periplasmic adaptor subunit [Kiritimatiellia bacterium]
MVQRILFNVIICAFLCLHIFFYGCGKNSKKGQKAPTPAPVTVAEVIRKAMPIEIRTFGTVEPSETVAVKAQVSGVLKEIKFREGQDVKKDEVLFIIDPVPFQNVLKQAEAALSRDKIQHENAKKETKRQDELLKKGLTSQDAYDQAKTAADGLGAAVKANEAVLENAKVQVGYCTIRSPIDGKTGKYLVDQGNLVTANETTLNTINQIKPIDASFTVPEHNLGEICRQMAAGKLKVQAFLPDEPEKTESGILTFIDNSVDRDTGTIRLLASFPNENGRLWPGQYIKLSLMLSVQQNAIVVPSNAVLTGQKGTYVYIIKSDLTAETRSVKVARQLDDWAIIAEGLKAGESVVAEGQQRLGPGTKVEIKNPSAKTTPVNQ